MIAYVVLAVVLRADALDGRIDLRPGRQTWMVVGGVGLLTLALLLALRALGVWWSDAIVWPVVLAACGLVLLWRQAETPEAVRNPRTVLGAGLIVGGGVIFLSETDAIGGLGNLAIAAGVIFAGTALVFGPWWVRLNEALTAERAARIRSQERAEVAAHLHDSVLQTLALIQRQADDPREVAQLARRQERELRSWLNEEEPAAASLAGALRDAAADVEALHGVEVEVVAVGDLPIDERTSALAAAAREAMTNAAKFSGVPRIDVYAEMADGKAEVFVRDRGAGFDPAAVPEDRRGVRESIVGRMERHGGSARVRSTPGAGTEISLSLIHRVDT